MSKLRIFAVYWLPTFIWMMLIFSASADAHSADHSSYLFMPLLHWLCPNIPDDQAEKLHHYFRKCCHLTEYAILGLLVRRTLIHGVNTGFPAWSWRLIGCAVGIVFLYACSDEFHQIFVPTRTPLFSDVCIDTAGGSTGLLLAWVWQRQWRKC